MTFGVNFDQYYDKMGRYADRNGRNWSRFASYGGKPYSHIQDPFNTLTGNDEQGQARIRDVEEWQHQREAENRAWFEKIQAGKAEAAVKIAKTDQQMDDTQTAIWREKDPRKRDELKKAYSNLRFQSISNYHEFLNYCTNAFSSCIQALQTGSSL